MTRNAETPRAESGAFQEVLDIGGDAQTAAMVTPVARPLLVITRGRLETVVRCPGCGSMHRHVGLGKRRGPCGAVYRIQPRRGRAAA